MQGHWVLRVWLEGDTLRFADLDEDWFREAVNQGKFEMGHEEVNDTLVFTATDAGPSSVSPGVRRRPGRFPEARGGMVSPEVSIPGATRFVAGAGVRNARRRQAAAVQGASDIYVFSGEPQARGDLIVPVAEIAHYLDGPMPRAHGSHGLTSPGRSATLNFWANLVELRRQQTQAAGILKGT